MGRGGDPEGWKKAGHDKNFVPAKVVKEKVVASYPHMQEEQHVKKNFRDEEGNVVTGPRNFLTNPPKIGKVGKRTTFAGVIPYMNEGYDVAKELARKEHAYHLTKI